MSWCRMLFRKSCSALRVQRTADKSGCGHDEQKDETGTYPWPLALAHQHFGFMLRLDPNTTLQACPGPGLVVGIRSPALRHT